MRARTLARCIVVTALLLGAAPSVRAQDITDEVLHTMARYDNICKYIHLPAQSGNSRILKLMNRTYDRAWYIQKIDRIRAILGEDCGISNDMIAGFCYETEEEHQDTLTFMDAVQYDFAYMFYYSERPGTPASKSAGSTCGAPGSYTLDGPPDRTIAAGLRASSSATGMECGTSSE